SLQLCCLSCIDPPLAKAGAATTLQNVLPVAGPGLMKPSLWQPPHPSGASTCLALSQPGLAVASVHTLGGSIQSGPNFRFSPGRADRSCIAHFRLILFMSPFFLPMTA